jgi:hypothetical protein
MPGDEDFAAVVQSLGAAIDRLTKAGMAALDSEKKRLFAQAIEACQNAGRVAEEAYRRQENIVGAAGRADGSAMGRHDLGPTPIGPHGSG